MTSELMRLDILDQPVAIAETVDGIRSQLAALSLQPQEFQRIIFAGSGDSHIAPLALQEAAHSNLGMPTYALTALSAAHYWSYGPRDLLVAISISGASARTLQAVGAAGRAGASTIALTVNQESPLAQASQSTLRMPFRSRSRKTPHAADYAATLAAIAAMIEWLSGQHLAVLDNVDQVVGAALSRLEAPCSELGTRLADGEVFYFLGGGPSLASAWYGAAKFWEAAGFHAFYLDLEEFGHGLHLVVNKNDPAFVVAPEGAALERAVMAVKGLAELGARTVVVTDCPSEFPGVSLAQVPVLGEEWSPFVTCLPLQWLCWAIANAKGFGRRHCAEVYERAQTFLRS